MERWKRMGEKTRRRGMVGQRDKVKGGGKEELDRAKEGCREERKVK